MNAKIKEALASIAPSIAFSVKWEIDPNFKWDGDGPDPVEDGFDAYDVDVFARVIANGEILQGSDSLGGCYAKPNEQDPDINGYLPQMLEQAIQELVNCHNLAHSVRVEANKATAWLKAYMRSQYEERAAK